MSLSRLDAAILVAATWLSVVGPARAEQPKGLYVGLEGGAAWTAPLVYEPFYYNCTLYYPCGLNYNAITYDVGYSAGAQIGYGFGNGLRLEFEYNYRNNSASTIATGSGTESATGGLTSNNFMVNLLYDFDTGSKWIPYVGFGLGIAEVSANTIKPSSTAVVSGFIDGSSSKFAAQFILGVEYAISDRFGVTLDWRGLWASSADFTYGIGCSGGSTTNCTQTGNTNYDYWSGALNIGLRVRF